MNPAYAIRCATLEDISTITRQRYRMFEDMGSIDYTQTPGINEAYADWLTPRLSNGLYIGWLALDGDSIIGGVGVEIYENHPMPVDLATRHPYLVNVYVEPDYRRRGIARALVQAALDWGRSQGFHIMRLHASAEGRPLYESLGFTLTNEMRRAID